jgi:hypothetical protein
MPGEPPEIVGSPFKRHRASIQDIGGSIMGPIGSNTNDVFPPSVLAAGHSNNGTPPASTPEVKLEAKADSEEEL